MTATTGSTVALADYSDSLSNFVRVGSNTVYWITEVRNNNGVAKVWRSTMTPTANNGLTNVYNVALSQNKAAFITDSGQVSVYKH